MKRSLGICYSIYSVHRKMIYKGGLGIQIEPIYIHSGQVFIHKVWKLYFFSICILFGLQVTQKYRNFTGVATPIAPWFLYRLY